MLLLFACTVLVSRFSAWVPLAPQPRAGLEPQFVSVNMGKRSLSIDMKDPASMVVVLKLLEDADVFVSILLRVTTTFQQRWHCFQ